MLNRPSSLTKNEPQPGEIMSVLKLKLMAKNNENLHAKDFHKPTHSIINTPSTIVNTKKFKSCQLYRKQDQSACLTNKVQNVVFNRQKISESTTRILSIQQIRKHEKTRRQHEENKQRVRSSSSKKIFVSLSKRNSVHLQNSKHEKDLIPAGPVLREEAQISTNQKLKLNVYRNIARSRNF